MERELLGKTALVTGGSRGIGRAICLELAEGGANVVLCYAGNEAAAQETVQAVEALGAKALAVRCDVSDAEQVDALAEAVLEAFGRIDILVNNAGITRDNLLMRMSEADFDQVVAANLKGAFLCMKAVSKLMLKQRYGRIVNLSSVVALRGNAGQVNYAASKAGIVGMTKSLAKELASRGVTVNAVAPGFIETDMTAALSESARAAAQDGDPFSGGRRPLRRIDLSRKICRNPFQAADVDGIIHHIPAAPGFAGMLADKTAGCGERVILPDQPDGVPIPSLAHQRNVPGNVHVCGTQGNTGDGLAVGAGAAAVLDVLHIVVAVADQSLVNHVRGFITDGAVRGFHNGKGGLLHDFQSLHCRVAVQYIPDQLVQLSETDPAGRAFSAGLGMAQFQKRPGHIYRTQSRRAGFDSSLQIFVKLFYDKPCSLGRSDF